MPDILINELSAEGQAGHAATADDLMYVFVETYKAMEPMLCGGSLYGHSMFRLGQLTKAMTVHQWLTQRHTGKMQIVQALTLRIVNKAPKIDNWLRDNVPDHACFHVHLSGSTPQHFSGLAGAAHKQGWLLSIRDCNSFPSGVVEVDYCELGKNIRRCQIAHFVVPTDASTRRRMYDPSPKHKTKPSQNADVRIAPMDLNKEEGQRALDCARTVPDEQEPEKRVFALYNAKLYVFFMHLPQLYHGYHVENPREYQTRDAKIYNQLREWGWVE